MRFTRLVTAILLAAYLPACATYTIMPDRVVSATETGYSPDPIWVPARETRR